MSKNTKVKQQSREDCGAACLASVASYYGLEIPITTLRSLCGTNSDGSSIKGIIDGAASIGINAEAYKTNQKEKSQLKEISKPSILHLIQKNGWLHFVVLYKFNKNNAIIMDPADGYFRSIKIDELISQWSGYIITLKPNINFKKGNKKENLNKALFQLFKANTNELIPAAIGAIAYIIAGFATSLFLQQIIDKILPTKESSLLLIFTIIMVTVAILSIITEYCRQIFSVRGSINIDAALVTSYISKILRLSPSFLSTRSSGELHSRINDIHIVRNFISGQLLIIFISIVSLIVATTILLTFSWKLALIALCSIPFYIILYLISNKINKRINRENIIAAATFEEDIIETLAYSSTIRLMGAENLFTHKFFNKYSQLLKLIYKNNKYSILFSASSESITKGLSLFALIIGSYYVISGELSLGEFISFYTIIAFFSAPISSLIASNDQITESKIAAERVFEILSLDDENEEKCIDINFENYNSIEVQNIALTFPGRMPIFENISFQITPGENLAIIGESGSGKSSIAAILMKAMSQSSGTITIDGTSIAQISTIEWRNFISIVPQKVEIFNASILENLVPNTNEPDIKFLLGICKKIGLDDFIKKQPEGLLTKTGEKGCKLSGGEKQKIAIARALYRTPQILILDEAASFLDKKSEDKIFNYLQELNKDTTYIIISHGDKFIDLAKKSIEIKPNAHS